MKTHEELEQRCARLEAALLTLASIVDAQLAQKSPHYPCALNNPELPLRHGDLEGLWFGTWEATSAALSGDPRWTGEVVR